MESRQPSVKVEEKYKIQSLTLTHAMDQAPCIEPEALSELRWFLECYLKAGAHKGKIILQDAKILQQYKLKQKGRKDKLMTPSKDPTVGGPLLSLRNTETPDQFWGTGTHRHHY